jgi:uncharacterized C2H2 Zn-finger protein
MGEIQMRCEICGHIFKMDAEPNFILMLGRIHLYQHNGFREGLRIGLDRRYGSPMWREMVTFSYES